MLTTINFLGSQIEVTWFTIVKVALALYILIMGFKYLITGKISKKEEEKLIKKYDGNMATYARLSGVSEILIGLFVLVQLVLCGTEVKNPILKFPSNIIFDGIVILAVIVIIVLMYTVVLKKKKTELVQTNISDSKEEIKEEINEEDMQE